MDPGGAGLNWRELGLTLARSFFGTAEETVKPPAPADPPTGLDCHTQAAPTPLLLHSHYLPQVSCPSQVRGRSSS